MRQIYLPLCIAFVSAACAPLPPAEAASQAGRECFWASQVSGFSDAGPDRALVRIGTREVWELTLSPGCPDVDWALKIGIKGRSSERICPGRPAELLVPEASGRGLRSCLVSDVRRLSPEEAAAARGLTPAP